MQKHNRFPVSISLENYKQKPTNVQWVKMKYELHYLNMNELLESIQEGYNYCHSYIGTGGKTFSNSSKTNDNLQETYLVLLDIDKAPWTFHDFCNRVSYKPTLCYTTPSNIMNVDNRYRAIYQFDKPIYTNKFYGHIFDGVVERIKESIPDFYIKDRTCRNVAQQMGGNGTGNFEHYFSKNIYSFSDFVSDTSLNIPVKYSLVDGKQANKQTKDEAPEDNSYIEIKDQEFKQDFFNIINIETYLSFRDKYAIKYPFFNETILPEVDEDTPFIELPEDFTVIQRDWLRLSENKRNGDSYQYSTVVKTGPGKRHAILYKNALLRRRMMLNLSFEHLLYCLAWERQEYIDNRDGEISNNELFKICRSAYNANCNKLKVKRDKRKTKVNKVFCEKYDIRPQQIAGQAKRYKNDIILLEHYDESLSVKENLFALQKKGYNISQRTLYRWCNSNAIPPKGRVISSPEFPAKCCHPEDVHNVESF